MTTDFIGNQLSKGDAVKCISLFFGFSNQPIFCGDGIFESYHQDKLYPFSVNNFDGTHKGWYKNVKKREVD
ncbi:hypothetical protein LCGC14_1081160 [marine sediment metagenome]|uniref:Uncharacterized protein n=1 Tax=marine sediment metagenome TaxID=412755 RepID=A0A0F9QL04_9ZZZZ